MVSKFWGEVIQLSGLMGLIIGICIEIYYKADFGYTILTAGSLFYAIGTKFKHREVKNNGR
jgi:cytochrome bd-type quinol oxidase subunit 1